LVFGVAGMNKPNKKTKVAVVGAGAWGKNLVRNFHELGVLHTICDSNREIELAYRKQHPEVNFFSSISQLLRNPSSDDLDAVVVATPAELHYHIAKEFLLAEKHVFVEKPLALNVREGLELLELAGNKRRILMVGHILQYHPALIKLKELIDRGELGKIQYIYSNRLNIGKIRTEENILWSFAPHDVSAMLMLLNEMPERVCASGGSYLQVNIPDVTLTTMDFPSGVKAHIFVSWLHPFKDQKLVVVGDKKMAVFDDVGKEKLILYPHKVEWIERTPVACKAQAEIIPIVMEEPLKSECRHFLECIERNQNPKTDGREGLSVLEVLQASQESLNRNGTGVPIAQSSKLKAQRGSFEREPSTLSYFVHESSYVDGDCDIGDGSRIWHFSHILKGSKIGRDCRIGQNVVIGPNVTVGDGCKIQNNVSVYEGVTLEENVFCGPSMVFTNVFNPRSEIPRMTELKKTMVRKGATIGANATIICGHTIGKYAFVGAGAVVTKDVPDYALMVGNPASVRSYVCECGAKLKFESELALCGSCGKRYQKKKGVVSVATI
jgi:UDP-2-acetamido-3-amino-2,3-dideoxy-glucuronate N-acetyltransferase